MPELYYAIVNILDYLALNEVCQVRRIELLKTCDTLLPYTGSEISDIADANDCGSCNDWDTLIIELRKLHESGDRI